VGSGRKIDITPAGFKKFADKPVNFNMKQSSRSVGLAWHLRSSTQRRQIMKSHFKRGDARSCLQTLRFARNRLKTLILIPSHLTIQRRRCVTIVQTDPHRTVPLQNVKSDLTKDVNTDLYGQRDVNSEAVPYNFISHEGLATQVAAIETRQNESSGWRSNFQKIYGQILRWIVSVEL
jgi:hypothetical protein